MIKINLNRETKEFTLVFKEVDIFTTKNFNRILREIKKIQNNNQLR